MYIVYRQGIYFRSFDHFPDAFTYVEYLNILDPTGEYTFEEKDYDA